MAMLDQIELVGLRPSRHERGTSRRQCCAFRQNPHPQVITAVSALPPVGGVNTFDVERGKAALAFESD